MATMKKRQVAHLEGADDLIGALKTCRAYTFAPLPSRVQMWW